MSTETIQQLVQELEALPESDLRQVLKFLAKLKQHRAAPASVAIRNPALAMKGGLLVFTGNVESPDTDWDQLVRDERDEDLVATATGQPRRR
jgi:hypothetical protein